MNYLYTCLIYFKNLSLMSAYLKLCIRFCRPHEAGGWSDSHWPHCSRRGWYSKEEAYLCSCSVTWVSFSHCWSLLLCIVFDTLCLPFVADPWWSSIYGIWLHPTFARNSSRMEAPQGSFWSPQSILSVLEVSILVIKNLKKCLCHFNIVS